MWSYAEYVNLSAGLFGVGPAGVVMTTSTWPTVVPWGAVAVIMVSDTKVNDADTPPNLTAETPVKPLPEMVTGVPPASRPVFGVSRVTPGPFGVTAFEGAELGPVPDALVAATVKV